MRSSTGRNLARVFCLALLISFILPPAGSASAAGYPRRIAVAPFTSLTPEDIGPTLAVLPRLVASRLMALAGADVLILPEGKTSPEEAAREAKYPLLLKGTVSKLGKGYSIDTTVVDLAEGKNAGAFFAAAATEDDIITQLGILSAQIAEKIFAVQGAVRAVSPAPVYAPPSAAAPVLPAPPAIGGMPAAASSAPASASATAASSSAPAPTTLAGGWLPTTLKKVGQSDKIAGEMYGVVAVDKDKDGSDLVAAYGKNLLYLYKVKGTEILPYTRFRKPVDHHILWVDAFDLDGDGVKEILVTDLIEESVQSYILKRVGDAYMEVAGDIHYYLVVLPDWGGKPTLVGQYQGITSPFQGKIVTLRWDGKKLVPGEPLPHDTDISPLSGGIPGLSSARFGKEWRLICSDDDSYLRVLDAKGKSLYRSRIRYGTPLDFFEWGPVIEIEGRRKQYFLWKSARLAPGSGEEPFILTNEVKKGFFDLVGGSYDTTRLVLLRWDGGEFVEKAATQVTGQFLSGGDFLPSAAFSKGGRIIASVIEKTGTIFTDQVSRLHLYQAE